MSVEEKLLIKIIEGALMSTASPMTVRSLRKTLFPVAERPELTEVKAALDTLKKDYDSRGVELVELASGFCFRVSPTVSNWIGRIFEEKPQKYSRAMLETLAIIAYKQPLTRAQIEDIRGVAVSSSIMRSFLERDWVKIVGQKEVPGRPSIYATTKEFLDYFNLKSLEDLPELPDLKEIPGLEIPEDETITLNHDALLDDGTTPLVEDEKIEAESELSDSIEVIEATNANDKAQNAKETEEVDETLEYQLEELEELDDDFEEVLEISETELETETETET